MKRISRNKSSNVSSFLWNRFGDLFIIGTSTDKGAITFMAYFIDLSPIGISAFGLVYDGSMELLCVFLEIAHQSWLKIQF